jgi:hypothetical protein
MHVAADLERDHTPQWAEPREVRTRGGLGQFPPDVELGRTVRRAATALDDQRRPAEMVDEVVELGRDVTRV